MKNGVAGRSMMGFDEIQIVDGRPFAERTARSVCGEKAKQVQQKSRGTLGKVPKN